MDEALARRMRADATAEVPVAQETPAGMTELGVELERLNLELDKLEQQRKPLQARYDEIRKLLLPDAMRAAGVVSDAGLGSFTLPSGAKIHLRNDIYVSVDKLREADLFNVLKAMGEGALVRETIHPSTLKAWVKDRLEQNLAMPVGIAIYPESTAVVTKHQRKDASAS